MTDLASLTFFPVFLPLLSGLVMLRFHIVEEGERHRLVCFLTAVNVLLVVLAALNAWGETFVFWRLGRGLDLAFRMDSMALLFSLLVSLLWPSVTFFAFRYLKHRPPEKRFFSFFLATNGALIGVAAAANFLTLYLFYELVTFLTLPLVMHGQEKEAIRAAVLYLLYSIAGAALALSAFFFFDRFCSSTAFVPGGTLSLYGLAGHEGELRTAVFLCLLGFGAKAGLFPLHAWLPAAHPVAPTPASAVLSGLITKAGIFAMIRVVYFLIGPAFLRGTWVQTALLSLALVSILMGSILAYMEKHLKKRIAYSSISQLSYAVFALMLLTPDGLIGAFMQIVAHAFAKTCLFLASGIVIYFTLPTSHYHYVDQLTGVGKELPITMTCFALASLSLIGLPPTGGFVGKWFMMTGALSPELGWIGPVGIGVLLTSALLTAGYLLPIVTSAFFPGKDYDYSKLVPVRLPMDMRLPLILTSTGALMIGLLSGWLTRWFETIAYTLL